MTISRAKAAMFGKLAYELFEEELFKSIERHIDEFKTKAKQDTLCACKEVKERYENTPEKR